MPKVTIITAIYNKEELIDKCVSSVLSQSFKDFEYILVDDESPDKCPQICDEYAKNDNRIKVIHRKNGGHAIAVNTGISSSTGDYITILDADDYFCDNNAITEMVKIADENNCEIVITDFLKIWNDENRPQIMISTGIEMLEYLITQNIYHPTTRSRLFHRNVFQTNGLFKDFICDDEEWTPKSFYWAKRVGILPKVIYARTTPVDSVTQITTEENYFKKAHDRSITAGILIDFFENETLTINQKKSLYKRFIALYVSSLYTYVVKLRKENLKSKLLKRLEENKQVMNSSKFYNSYNHHILTMLINTFGIKSTLMILRFLRSIHVI